MKNTFISLVITSNGEVNGEWLRGYADYLKNNYSDYEILIIDYGQGDTGNHNKSELLNEIGKMRWLKITDVCSPEVAMAAGMAKQGMKPVFAVYSTFLQRAYDMLIHDVAIQGLHVVFAIDRAGLVGEDGETHHGVFDPAFLDTVPGMTVLCPSSYAELESMLHYAVYELKGPVAVRYPRGGQGEYQADAGVANSVVMRSGKDITLAGYGITINALTQCAERLAQEGIEAEIVKFNTITPLDGELVAQSVGKTGRLLVAEEAASSNCVGRRLAADLLARGISAKLAFVNSGSDFIPHGTVSQLQTLCKLDGASLYQQALEVCGHGNH